MEGGGEGRRGKVEGGRREGEGKKREEERREEKGRGKNKELDCQCSVISGTIQYGLRSKVYDISGIWTLCLYDY